MLVGALFPFKPENLSAATGLLVGLVLPGGCNLGCPYCAVAQRRERQQSTRLEASDYVAFIDDLAEHEPVLGVSIVGDEPLMPRAWPYTQTIMAHVQSLGLAHGLITNGTRLAQHAEQIAEFEPKILVVSLDGVGAAHDRARGAEGAYAAALEGLQAALSQPVLRDRVVVGSVLRPKRPDALHGLPSVLAKLEIQRWVVTPLITFNPALPLAARITSPTELRPAIEILGEEAARAGVELFIDDEFGATVRHWSGMQDIPVRRVGPAVDLIRLNHDGATSLNAAILDPIEPSTLRWDRLEPAHQVLYGLRREERERRTDRGRLNVA